MIGLCDWRARIGLFNSSYRYCSFLNGRAGSTSPGQCFLRIMLTFLCQLSSLPMRVVRNKSIATPTTSEFIADHSGGKDRTLLIGITTKAPSLLKIIRLCYLMSLSLWSKLITVFLPRHFLLLLSGDVESNPGPPKVKPVGKLPLRIFRRYLYRIAKSFGQSADDLAIHFFGENLISRELWDRVQLSQTPMQKANILLTEVDSKIDADRGDKTLRKLCRLMSEHEHLKNLSKEIMNEYEAVLSGDKKLLSSSESNSSEEESDWSKGEETQSKKKCTERATAKNTIATDGQSAHLHSTNVPLPRIAGRKRPNSGDCENIQLKRRPLKISTDKDMFSPEKSVMEEVPCSSKIATDGQTRHSHTATALLSSATRHKRQHSEDASLASTSSENRKPIDTNRLAIYMRDKSSKILMKNAETTIYELRKTKELRDTTNRVSKYSVGNKRLTAAVQERVLMLVGATGAGKSTLINGMVNYILGVNWEDKFRFQLIVDGKRKSQIHSQTQWITSYTIHHMKGSEINYTLTLIDTPGFGDTEGIERDKRLVRQIKKFFSMKNGIDALHGIGFVAQSPLARLTPTQHYIFQSILAIFGKDTASNIMLMITFADGSHPPVLEAVKAADVPFQSFFKFNNSALFANPATASEPFNFDSMYWKMGLTNFQQFFQCLVKMECRSLKLTKEVLEERHRLESVVQGLQPHIQIGLGKISELEQTEEVLKQHRAEIEASEDFTYKVEIPKIREVGLPPKTYVTNCIRCNFTCHENCRIPDSGDKFKCSAMDFQGDKNKAKCRICPQHCHWSEHRNNEFKFETYTVIEERQYSDLKQRFEEAKSGETAVGSIIAQLQEELKKEEKTVFSMMAEAHESLKRLDEIALKPNPLTQVEYIELLIESEKQERRRGWKKRVKTLNDLKEKATILNTLRHTKADSSEGKVWWKRWMDGTSSLFSDKTQS